MHLCDQPTTLTDMLFKEKSKSYKIPLFVLRQPHCKGGFTLVSWTKGTPKLSVPIG